VTTYLIGDIQGCDDAFDRLLQHISFSPSRDTLYLLGDLINRGPGSAQVLRRCMQWADAVKPVLGNHDLHLLATAHGVRQPGRRDTIQNILDAPDREALLGWLCQQPLARHLQSPSRQDLLMVHAGVLPQWTLCQTLTLANEVHELLKSNALPSFLQTMYGNTPNTWNEALTGPDRIRVIVNALTRLRFCSAQGAMDFESSESAETSPAGLMPWFDCPDRQTEHVLVAFGHWSTLGLLNRPHLLALDTGCVWGGCLSAMELGNDFSERQLHQVHCEAAQRPG
jgi:bis(5'-nucleosyl)-tetraphosphatase (symmetrical)